jgi:broad specificity phosphatase PhoE
VRIRAFTTEVEPLLERADVLAFSHMGTLRALLANLRGLSDQAMMTIEVDNGAAFLFNRTIGPGGVSVWTEQPLPSPVIAKTAPVIAPPPVAPPPNLR